MGQSRRGGAPGKLWPSVLLDIGLVCLALGVVWGGIFHHLGEQRSEIAARAARTSMNLAHAAAGDIGRTIAGIDEAMLFLRAAYVAAPEHFDIAAWARGVAATDQPVFQYSITDARGWLLASSLGTPATPLDLSGFEPVRVQLNARDDVLFISKPVIGRVSHRQSIQFTRRIVGADGSFLGVLVFSVDPDRLVGLYREMDLGRGALGLVGLDAILRARAPDGQDLIGHDLSQSPVFALALKHKGGTVTIASPLDGVHRITSFRRVAGYPLFVTIGLDEKEVFAAFERYRRQYETVGVGLSLFALVGGMVLFLSRRRLLASRRDLAAAIENIGQGLVMLGPRGRIAVINRRAVEMLGEVPAASSGRLASGQHEEHHPGGRILEVRTQGLPD
ncbi:MAG: hypothetical protein ABI369_02345, partial [Acetobacteraceae bacterium]